MGIRIFIILGIFIFSGLGATSYEDELLYLINQYRIKKGISPLVSDKILNEIAKSHSIYMYKKNRLSHENFEKRFLNSKSNICVENVGWNALSAEEMFRLWRESDSHNENMLKKDIKRAGISIVGKYTTFFACQ